MTEGNDNIPNFAPEVSDVMLRRDNFFHNCWMSLKQKHSELWPEMSTIELELSGFAIVKDKDGSDTEKPDAEPDGQIV